MCGIAGLVAARGRRVDSASAAMIVRVLAHRGPDDVGFLSSSGGTVRVARETAGVDSAADLYLIHRRLSILDLSPKGWQPMSYGDGRYHIILNGEIYNYLELRSELEALGHRFRSTSDTEVLLAAWSEWGAAMLPRLVGMFAFALLDTQSRRLVLVRDFFGIKPLYYCDFAAGFAFASELKALTPLDGVSRAIDPEPLYFYLRHGMTEHDDRTLFASIRQLPAAHLMEIDLDDPSKRSVRRYWSLPLDRTEEMSFDEAAARMRDLFVESVSLHLRSDVPVGAALSGGIDSSAIVMAMRSVVGERLDLHAFSYIAADPILNEERWVDLVAERSRATLHKVRLDEDDLVRDLPALIASQDQPFASTSIYAQYAVFRLAAEARIKVMLDGQGADELLAGYRPFLAARIGSLLRSGSVASAGRLFGAASKLPGVGRGYLAKTTGELFLPTALQGPLRAMVGKELLPPWLDASWFREHGIGGMPVARARGRSVLRASLHDAVTRSNLPALLRYEDRNSMAFSIESRVPFLTPKIAAFVFSLPESYIVSPRGESKSVFRAAMRGLVPDEILDRRDKIGFATPERDWLARLAPWSDAMLANGARLAPLNIPLLRGEIDAVRSGAKPFHNGIWRALNLTAWARQSEATFS
jgi:asparagine synthase (glutamine-hydrolysing)